MTLYVCSVCKNTHHNSQPACPQVFNMTKLTETVTIQREVPSNIADLVHFVKYLRQRNVDVLSATDNQLISAARDFWETQHGED